MRATGVAMVTVQVRDFDRCLKWYREVLGLEPQWLEPGEFATLVAPGTQTTALALATDHPDRIPGRAGLGWTPTVVVDDFDAAMDDLRRAGVVFDAEEEGGDEGYRLIRVLDPEGNPVGITTA